FVRWGDAVVLRSVDEVQPAQVPIDVDDPSIVEPEWARYVAGVVAELRPRFGLRGDVSTTLPLRAGLSSSAALEVAVALALGAPGDLRAIAELCQRAEHRGPQVPCGVMDQIASLAGVAGSALLLDCATVTWQPVTIPPGLAVQVVHCGVARRVGASAYAERRAQCAAAASLVGPLRDAHVDEVARIGDTVVRRRARHVVTENARVHAFAEALRAGDAPAVAEVLRASHRSLRDDFEVSTPELDALVDRLQAMPGVYGARLTGAGFGGCVVAIVDATTEAAALGGWRVVPSAGAHELH
ncbi:MAG TPA: hypothetical protein VGQ20_07820, partial [Acidimicrobiales bacterium]|nr:hypothetical protein [Acidimicrobiales bacterium]